MTYLLLLACLNTQINEEYFLNKFWLVMKHGSVCTTLKLSDNHYIENALPHKESLPSTKKNENQSHADCCKGVMQHEHGSVQPAVCKF
jgi:hypothetical protein